MSAVPPPAFASLSFSLIPCAHCTVPPSTRPEEDGFKLIRTISGKNDETIWSYAGGSQIDILVRPCEKTPLNVEWCVCDTLNSDRKQIHLFFVNHAIALAQLSRRAQDALSKELIALAHSDDRQPSKKLIRVIMSEMMSDVAKGTWWGTFWEARKPTTHSMPILKAFTKSDLLSAAEWNKVGEKVQKQILFPIGRATVINPGCYTVQVGDTAEA